jgi:hypothetical protein
LKSQSQQSFVEAPVQFPAQFVTKTDIVSLSEVSLTLISNIQPTTGQIYRVQSDFLKTLELENINLRISDIEKIPESQAQYKIRGYFVGLTDKELGQIRMWVRKKLSGPT